MARHMSRRHSSQHGRSTPSSSISRSRTPSSDRGSSATREFTSVYAADSVATPDIVREATLCMIRRNDGYNVPSMSQYLQACFPRIPADWHMPMIVAAFTAVQKASAMHGDTQLRDDDQRKEWARRSLARWGHGLGAVEPGRYRTNPQESISRESSVDRDETRNLLETRELPVSGDSRFAQADVERVFQASSVGNGIVNDREVGQGDRTVPQSMAEVRAVMDEWGKLGDCAVVDSCDNEVRRPVAHPTVVSGKPGADQSSGPVAESVSGDAHTDVPVSAAVGVTSRTPPLSFADLLLVEVADSALRERMVQPLTDPVSPLMTPRASSVSQGEGAVALIEPTFDVLASPHPSIDGESSITVDSDAVPVRGKDVLHSDVVRRNVSDNQSEKENHTPDAGGHIVPTTERAKKSQKKSQKAGANKPVGGSDTAQSESAGDTAKFRIPLKSKRTAVDLRVSPLHTAGKRKSDSENEPSEPRRRNRRGTEDRQMLPPRHPERSWSPDRGRRFRPFLPPPPRFFRPPYESHSYQYPPRGRNEYSAWY